MKQYVKWMICLCLICLLPVLCACGSDSVGSTAQDGSKTIAVTVVYRDGSEKLFEIHTDEQYLEGALLQENLIDGDNSATGIFITSVDGEQADESNQEWWCLTKDGEMWNYGAASTKISDGDQYELTLTVGY